MWSNNSLQHIRIGVAPDYDSDVELCDMLMEILAWSYELVYSDDFGTVNVTDPNASIGLAGDLINGRIDLICDTTPLSIERLAAHDFAYPFGGSDRDVYIYRDNKEQHVQQSKFIGRPFTWRLWLTISVSAIVTVGVFYAMRAIIAGSCLAIRLISDSMSCWFELTMGIAYKRSKQLRNYTSIRLASALWLLLWGPFILQLYKVDLQFYLTVSDPAKLPIVDFDSLVQQLGSGAFRLLIYYNSMPHCPDVNGNDAECWQMFDDVAKHPLIYFGLEQDLDDMPNDAVTVMSYSTISIPGKQSRFFDHARHRSKLIAVRSDQVTNPLVSFPLQRGFSRKKKDQMNVAIIFLQQSFMTMEAFRKGRIMAPIQLVPIAMVGAFSLLHLTSAFEMLAAGLGVSFCVFLIEIGYSRRLQIRQR